MKSNAKIIVLITLGILYALSLITINYSFNVGNYEKMAEYNDDFTLDKDNLKISTVSGKIHIDNNWTAAKIAGICTGNGTYSEPYVIEDLVIDGENSGTCILIENSEVYVIIVNCTIYNSDMFGAGITLLNVNNSQLIDNNCSSNYRGIYISNCQNNTVSGNTINNNIYGIFLAASHNNTVSGNFANNNLNGIYLNACDNNTISGNIMNNCGLIINGEIEQLSSHDIDTTNLVNGKPLYYYNNEVNLGPDDFLDAGQVILVNCTDSLISNLDISFSSIAISLYYCYNNTISGNTANNNQNGIKLKLCNNNTISGNTVNDNDYGILLEIYSYNNTITGNTANNNSYWGMYLALCYDNIILGNTANNNSRGIFLAVSSNNIISGNTANNNSFCGIELYYSDFNTVSGNTANDNINGIYLFRSNYNTISGNTLIGNNECIFEENCIGNTFSNNGDCTYGQGDSGVPIELIILVSVISGGAVIGVATLLLLIRKRKRIE